MMPITEARKWTMTMTTDEELELAELAQPAHEAAKLSREEWLARQQREGIKNLRSLMFQSSLHQLKAGKIRRLAPGQGPPPGRENG